MDSSTAPSEPIPGLSPSAPQAIAGRGREEELLEYIEGLREYLLLMAGRKLGPNLAAKIAPSDLVQETLVVAMQKVKTFQGAGETPARVRGWVERILVHQLANARHRYLGTGKRHLDREVSGTDPADKGTSPSTVVHREERQSALRAALERLPDHYRSVIVWRYWERLGYEAIGRNLGISTEAARKLGGRALIALRTMIGSGHDPF